MEEKRVDAEKDSDEKMECEEVPSGSESVEMTENTDSAEKAVGTEEKHSSAMSAISVVEIEQSSTSVSEFPTGVSTATDVAMEAVVDPEAPTELSTPPKKSILGNIKKVFSPPKTDGQKGIKSPGEKPESKMSSSKSMSPPEKTSTSAVEYRSEADAEGASAAPEGGDSFKKSEKLGMMKTIKKKITKMITKRKSTTSEDANLVSDEEIEEIESPVEPVKDLATIPAAEGGLAETPAVFEWTKGRQSLTEKPSLDLTVMTDLPSTWSGTDVFSKDVDRKKSETGENTSEEEIAGSLASTPEEIPDIQKDKDVSNVNEEPDSSTEDRNVPVPSSAEDPAQNAEISVGEQKNDKEKPDTKE